MLISHDAHRQTYAFAIHSLGVPATWKKTKGPEASGQLVVGFRLAGVKDQEIVNSYGINTAIITALAEDCEQPPEKFDQYDIHESSYVVQAVQEIILGGQLLAYKMIGKGR